MHAFIHTVTVTPLATPACARFNLQVTFTVEQLEAMLAQAKRVEEAR